MSLLDTDFDSGMHLGVVYDAEYGIRKTSRGELVLVLDDTTLGVSDITGIEVDVEDETKDYRSRRRHGCGTYRYGKTTGKVMG